MALDARVTPPNASITFSTLFMAGCYYEFRIGVKENYFTGSELF